MAIIVRTERADGTYTLNLWNSVFRIRSWQSRAAGERVFETFNLVAEGTDAAIIAAENQLSDHLYEAELFHRDPLRKLGILLRVQAESEASSRTALIYRGELAPMMQQNITPMLGRSGAFYQLTLERHVWETTSTGPTFSNVSVLGGVSSLTDMGGTLLGRLGALDVVARSGGGGPLHKIWVGCRPVYEGSTTFVAKWECEAGTNGTDASDTVDASDSGGNKVRVSFATVTTLAKRLSMTVTTFITTPKDLVGRYLVLLRGSVTSGVVALQMRSGFASSENFTPHKTVYVSNTTDQLLELGEVAVPPFGYRQQFQGNDAVKQFQLQFWAERVSGTGSLDMDCLVLIPAEHSFFVSGASLSHSVGDVNQVIFLTFEDDRKTVLQYTNDIPQSNLEFGHTNWAYPNGGGIMVIAAERNGSQVIGDVVDLEITRYPRWRTYAS